MEDIYQCEDTGHVYAIVRTGLGVTHVVHRGDLMPESTMLVTPGLDLVCY